MKRALAPRRNRNPAQETETPPKKHKRPVIVTGLSSSDRFSELRQPNIFGGRPLGAAAFREGDALSLLKFFVLNSFEARVVEEQIFAPASVDESKAFFRQFLNRAFCHFRRIPKK